MQLLKEVVKKEPNPVHPHPGPDLVTILPVKEDPSHQQENPDPVTILAKKDPDPDPNHLQDQRDPNLVRQASPDLVQEQREPRHSDVINSVLFTQALTYILTL